MIDIKFNKKRKMEEYLRDRAKSKAIATYTFKSIISHG
jgi:hypothetical protein